MDKCWHRMINMAWFSLISQWWESGVGGMLYYDVKTEEIALLRVAKGPTPSTAWTVFDSGRQQDCNDWSISMRVRY